MRRLTSNHMYKMKSSYTHRPLAGAPLRKLIAHAGRHFGVRTKLHLHHFVANLARAGLIDAQHLFYETNGILQYQDSLVSGERHVLEKVVPRYIRGKIPQIFDVGANIGNYTDEVLTYMPNARVIAFEPHPLSFAKMIKRFSDRRDQICLYNLGLSSQPGKIALYDYRENEGSAHASLYPQVIEEIHKGEIADNPVTVMRLDDFCIRNNIEYIDFLKIDAEGHELEILKGANRLISEKRICIVQFEFNEMNVFSRVFLRDFYIILKDFSMFRLAKNKLIPLGSYDSSYEIFKFQNILAILRNCLK
jgi:FkbM family methyltransferase